MKVSPVRLVVLLCAAFVPVLLPASGSAAKTRSAQPGKGGHVQGTALQPQPAAQTFFNGYRTVEGLQAFLDAQVAAHPNLAEKVDFGDSWCKAHAPCTVPGPEYNGYDMLALRITNREVPGPKPVFWFDAGIHANEIVPPELAMRFISWLLDNYNSDADAHWLVDYHDIWVVPMANPDAHHLVEAGGNQPLLQRKNADYDDGCTTFPPTAGDYEMLGTDLNRNFPFKWACCEGASNDPCSQVYRGPSAGSENETQAITSILTRILPDQRGPGDNDAAPLTAMGTFLTMHSIARVNFHPWNYSSDFAPNSTDLGNIAAHISAPEAGGNGYRYCQSGMQGCLGGADGNSMDWAYGDLGVAGVTIEVEGETFSPPYGQVEAVWNTNRQAITYLARLARTPYLQARGPDANAPAVAPSVVNSGSGPRISATINSAWSRNWYAQNIGGAEYYIDTPPWAGGTPRPLNPVDGQFDSQTEAVQATVDTTALAAGRHILFVRGRTVTSYEGHESWGPVSAVFLDVVQSGGTPVVDTTPTSTTGSPSRTPLPAPVALPGTASRVFPETGQTVSGVFLDYWDRNGGLPQQGFPISGVLGEVSSVNGQAYTMQYFERAVFEYHPENAAPNDVLLSLLGTFLYDQKYPDGAPGQQPNTSPGSVLFPETGKTLGGVFLDYWRTHGGLAQQGYPISDEFIETSDLDGKEYRVQYFERAVFEHHPENAGMEYEVLLSQLGTFRYRQTYGGP
jgi:hypothetical protein